MAVTETDREAIEAAARDYIEGWVYGDGERMRRCLHLALAKRRVGEQDPETGEWSVVEAPAPDMIEAAGRGEGTRHAKEYEVRVFDVFEGIASVLVRSVPYVDYLHIARFGDRWLIVNALWQRRDAA